MTTHPEFFLGLDLGQAQDFTALAVLERTELVPPSNGIPTRKKEFDYACRHLERFSLGTSYTDVVAQMVALLTRSSSADVGGKPLLAGCTLAVDQTGVGRPVVDLLRQALQAARAQVTLRPVLITAGHAVTPGEDGSSIHVPKKELVGTLQVLLQSRRLKVASTLPEAAILVKELLAFKVKVTLAATEQFGAWREGEHDDLVLAVAMAAFLGERSHKQSTGRPRVMGGWRSVPPSPLPRYS